MRAAFYTKQGPARDVLRVGEHPTYEPAEGEVRVRLRTSGVNPSDWKVRRGGFGRPLMAPLIIPHSDGAGEVDSIGPGVPASRIGERVWIWNGQWKRPFGTAAEFITLPSVQAVTLPSTIDFSVGASLGIPALTAMHAVFLAQAGPGVTVLVVGGAGAVGHYAIQFAKFRGARVFATVSNEDKAAHARLAGADAVINYRAEDVGTRIRSLTEERGVDVIVEMDLTANARHYPAILRPHAKVIIYGMSGAEVLLPSLWLMQNSVNLQFFLIYEISPADRAIGLAELGRLLEQGKLVHTIGLRLPLAAVAEAHEAVEGGKVIGNVILNID